MTEEEFLGLPEDGRKWELVNGEPTSVLRYFDHGVLKTQLVSQLLPVAKPLGYMTVGTAGFRMRNRNIRVPDVSFTSKRRIGVVRPAPGFGAAPDLCVEIISPSEEPGEMQRKVEEYFESGAEQVWHLFPETQTVRVFPSATASNVLGADDEIDGGTLLPGFRCRVAELFDMGL